MWSCVSIGTCHQWVKVCCYNTACFRCCMVLLDSHHNIGHRREHFFRDFSGFYTLWKRRNLPKQGTSTGSCRAHRPCFGRPTCHTRTGHEHMIPLDLCIWFLLCRDLKLGTCTWLTPVYKCHRDHAPHNDCICSICDITRQPHQLAQHRWSNRFGAGHHGSNSSTHIRKSCSFRMGQRQLRRDVWSPQSVSVVWPMVWLLNSSLAMRKQCWRWRWRRRVSLLWIDLATVRAE